MKARAGLHLLLACALLCGVVMPAACEEASIRSVLLAGHGELQLNVPKSWVVDTSRPTPEMPPTLHFGPKAGVPFAVMVTPFWPEGDAGPVPDAASLKESVRRAADAARAQAVEKTIDLKEIRGTSGIGYYYAVTDRAPKPDEFKFAAQGVIGVNILRVAFTILTNEGQGHILREALDMIRGAVHVEPATDSPVGEPRKANTRAGISGGDRRWLEFPAMRCGRR